MISFTVRSTFDARDRDEVAEILQKLTAASRQEPGCVSYIPHFVEDSSTIVIYEQYVDEAALEHHRNSPHFRRYATGALYLKTRDRQVENLTSLC
ncbi:putative quinol monooxygenase [Edaphobacter bradus]|uniref:putative quinol monooxygenase n=1 Tax=Edaphobacter bradus TaxID=2259016 RepID=UPI0021E0BB94|nr:putative quinol monooxygenase [Edaphobacter bradus]